ncbi:MAG TPA: flagellar biosynthetic protein FliO [Hyphomicrobiaceae bacterium]|nr:flagellar biosynthetic protein FliO [Hyphomicrobiaceae bacterium]
MWDILFYILVIVLLGGAAGAAVYFGRNYMQGIGPGVFGNRAERRLDVVEQSSIDGRRRLVLIRRDNVEHLIMTGGPVDLVIETDIGPRRAKSGGEVVEAPQPVFSRPQRAFGTSAANE